MVRTLFFLGLIAFAMTSAAMLIASWRMAERHQVGAQIVDPVDVAIVLGGGHFPDGVLEYRVRERARAAIHLFETGKASRIITTGGLISHHPDSHAAVIRDFLVANGVPAEAVLLEDRSRTTLENFRFAFEIMEAEGLSTFAIVTDSYHMTRSVWLARYLGHPPDGLSVAHTLEHETTPMRIAMILRETAAWWYHAYKIAGLWIFDTFGLPSAWRDRLVV